MDLDKEFVHSVCLGGDKALILASNRGVKPEILAGEGKAAWEYVLKHRKDYGTVPTPDVIFGKLGIDLEGRGKEGVQFWTDEVINRETFKVLRNGVEAITDKLKARVPTEAVEAFQEIHKKLREGNLTNSKVESLFALGKEVIAQYENAKNGIRGIPTPWKTMNEQTMGWWPEDLILFVGRLGVGKTWALLLVTHAAWKSGHKVLIASTEMNKVKMAMRFFAMHFRLPYDDLRKGKLGEFVEQKFKDQVAALLNEQGVQIIGGDFDFTIDGLEGAIEESECELAAIDGAYLIKNSGKDRHERVSNNFDDFKRIGKRRKIATVANSQFNRSAKAGQETSISAENVGITDVAGWNADAMFGLHQTEEMRENGQMGIKNLKSREGRGTDFTTRWDLERMDFAELRDDDDSGPPPATPSTAQGDDLEDLPF